MSSEHKYVIYFVFGITMGIILCLSCNFQPKILEESSQRQKRQIAVNNSLEDIQPLEKNVRVLCWVLTNPENHLKKAIHIKKTWGPRCNKLLFMSSSNDSTLGTIALPVKEGRENLWTKTKLAFKYVYENHFNDAEWFLKVDDDTYVIMENLRKMLYPHHHEAPIYFGCRYKEFTKQGFMSGGSGYVLSKEALRILVEVGLSNPRFCFPGNGFPEDAAMGVCLNFIGVVAGDSRDEEKRETFFPVSLDTHLFPAKRDKNYWYWAYRFYSMKRGFECCSNYPISFHYITARNMYTYEFLIYHLHPYGIIYNSKPLPTEKISIKIDIIKAKLDTVEKVRIEIPTLGAIINETKKNDILAKAILNA